MAGALGYGRDTYATSIAMAELSLLPDIRKADTSTIVVADGTSCRAQIEHGVGRSAVHVACVLAGALADPPIVADDGEPTDRYRKDFATDLWQNGDLGRNISVSSTASRAISEPRLIVVMGVSGCGKTSVGQGIAARFGIAFVEGDALHPSRNVEKMSAGIPLEDADRAPWLDRIGDELRNAQEAGRGLVVACSALKKIYRDRLRQAAESGLYFVFLRASRDTLQERVAARRNHYMPPSLLDSQLATLEPPDDEPKVISVDIDRIDVTQVVDAAQAELEREMGRSSAPL